MSTSEQNRTDQNAARRRAPEFSPERHARLSDASRDIERHVFSPDKVITTDVFDTVLLRKPISERTRFEWAAKKVAAQIGAGYGLSWQQIYDARWHVNKAAFGMLNAIDEVGEVSFQQVTALQLKLLKLPEHFAPLFLRSEIEVEKKCLEPNLEWIDALKAHRANGGRVIAISDTPLPRNAVETLIDQVAGPNLYDSLYVSSDENATKRRGDLFERVIAAENLTPHSVLHVGDHWHADQKVPTRLGFRTDLKPRPKLHDLRQKADAAASEWRRRFRQGGTTATQDDAGAIQSQFDLGHRILGPIVFEAAVMLWAHLAAIQHPERSVALFCARGGLRLRRAFEKVIENCELPLDIRRNDFMTSRLASAKAALAYNPDTVLDEIGGIYRRATLRDFLKGFGQTEMPDVAGLDESADPQALRGFLQSRDADGLKNELAAHLRLYRKYIAQQAQGASRLIMVDTGFYGSTHCSMSAAFPEYRWNSILLSRVRKAEIAKKHPHAIIGLWTDQFGYTPFEPRTAILRHWQLIEVLFEPNLPSVTSFKERDGRVVSNLECEDWQNRLLDNDTPLFQGLMSFLETLKPSDEGRFRQMSTPAWQRLRRALLFPSDTDLNVLAVPERSLDFGLEGHYKVNLATRQAGLFEALQQIRHSPWKEGAAATAFPGLRPLTNLGVEATYLARFINGVRRRRISYSFSSGK